MDKVDKPRINDYIEFWKDHVGKEIVVFTHDNKKFEGKLKAVMIIHMNIILETKEKDLAFRGQVIHHIEFQKGEKSE